MNTHLLKRKMKAWRAIVKITTAVSTVIFGSLLIFQLALADLSNWKDEKGIVYFKRYEAIPEKYSQNLEGEYWEELKNPNFPVTLIGWQLVTNPGSGDKYMDKRIIGKVKNACEKKFSEVKIEFTVYDEDGAQIAIVSSNLYDFKPGAIWKFEIPVTDDVEKAELKGLYIPAKELKKLEKQRKN